MWNRQAARFAVMIFQRRLASSTWALLCSLRKRMAKLDAAVDSLRTSLISEEEWFKRQKALQQRIAKGKLVDVLAEQTADEEGAVQGQETHEANEDAVLGSFLTTRTESARASSSRTTCGARSIPTRRPIRRR